MTILLFHFSITEDLLNVIELIAAAVTGAFGIVGVMVETRSKKTEGGRINAKGWITIVGLIVGTFFTIWIKSYQQSIAKKERKIAVEKSDSVNAQRAKEYDNNIAILKNLQSQDAIVLKTQDHLIRGATKSLAYMNSISDQQATNLTMENKVLQTSKLAVFPLYDLNHDIQLEFSLGKMDLDELGKFKNLLIKNIQKHSSLFYDYGVNNDDYGHSTINQVSFVSDSILKLTAYDFDSQEGQLWFMIKRYFLPDINISFFKKPMDPAGYEMGSMNYTFDQHYYFKLRFNFISKIAKCEIRLDHLSIGSNLMAGLKKGIYSLKSLDELDSSYARVSASNHFFSLSTETLFFSLTTKNTFRSLTGFMKDSTKTVICRLR